MVRQENETVREADPPGKVLFASKDLHARTQGWLRLGGDHGIRTLFEGPLSLTDGRNHFFKSFYFRVCVLTRER